MQWGGAHVWKVGAPQGGPGDGPAGGPGAGKVFAIGGWADGGPAYTFKTSELAFEILRQQPGLRPAPYLASRGLKWIQHYAAPGLSDRELLQYLEESHRIVSLKFSKKLQRELGLRGR